MRTGPGPVRTTLLLLVVACGNNPTDHKLPGASVTPHLDARPGKPACGDDVAFQGHSEPDAHYLYHYDDLGRLAHVDGTFVAGGTETTDYAYDNLGHMTHSLDVGPGGSVEVTADYDTLGDLLDYTYNLHEGSDSENDRYAMSDFTDGGQPRTQLITYIGGQSHFVIDYDESGRISHYVQDGVSTTTYTYDDSDSRTLTIDTDGGKFHGLIVYDDLDNEISEDWGGSDPNAELTERLYDYTGDHLVKATFKSGKPLAVVETDTLRYDCR